MALKIGIKKGFDINLQGSISDNIVKNIPSSSFAIKPDDFIGITRPKLLILLISYHLMNLMKSKIF